MKVLYCKCGDYLLWERDHWACLGCGRSPWQCECRKGEKDSPKHVHSLLEELVAPTDEEREEYEPTEPQ